MVSNHWLLPFRTQPTTTTTTANHPPATIGILSFEVATILSKTIHLHKSLTDSNLSILTTQTLTSPAVKTLVSSDHSFLLHLAASEKLADLHHLAAAVSTLCRKSAVPHLLGFQHIYSDIVSGTINIEQLGFLVKDMDSMIKRFERYVNVTGKLYCELEVLSQLELGKSKFVMSPHAESRKAFEQKVVWQMQDVRRLKDSSLWNQTFDKIMEMVARTVCTLYSRICFVFAETLSRRDMFVSSPVSENSVHVDAGSVKSGSGFVNSGCGLGPGRLFMECLNLTGSVSGSKFDAFDDEYVTKDDDDQSSKVSGACSVSSNVRKDIKNSGLKTRFKFKTDTKSKLLVQASEATVGGSALALHYANVIIVIEKLLKYPHLVGEEARDDLYQMLPTSLRLALKTSLKSYVKDLAIYDAPLAHEWKDRVDGILSWLAPMAHNMIRWQSERNFEQQQIVSRTNVLLLQTLYFADRTKTEAAICELLVGLNYICRYEHQQNALLDCASSFDFEECVEWQTQY